jgi:hypothetical protein
MGMTPKEMAILFHDTYEQLAPQFGYETREDTREFDEHSPNGQLMISVCEVVKERMVQSFFDEWQKVLEEPYG